MQRFQTSDIPVFLLTSQVGGLGLTLTAADRVIIVARPYPTLNNYPHGWLPVHLYLAWPVCFATMLASVKQLPGR